MSTYVFMQVACPVCEKKFKHKNTCTVHIKVGIIFFVVVVVSI
jgi:uncharacterized protein (DUF2225 family)